MYIQYTKKQQLLLAETSQPLIANTTAAIIVSPDPECLEATETERFVSSGCSCVLHNGRSYSAQFTIDHYLEFRGECKELTRAELSMALLGQLSAFTFSDEQTVRATSQRYPSECRQHSYTMFCHRGLRVCGKTSTFHLRGDGLWPHMYGNRKHPPANTICFADIQNKWYNS